MLNNIQISASLMCANWLNIENDLTILQQSGLIDFLHLDIIDGQFAPDFTMGSSIINSIQKKFKFVSDYHLMTIEPAHYFNSFPVNENDIFTIHQETSRNLHRDLVSIRNKLKARVGLALSPGTPLESLEYVIEDCDVILLMAVDPGYKGQPLVPQMLRKISSLKNIITKMGLNVKISVDGNVNCDNIPKMVAAGADILVLGSSGLFRNDISLEGALEKIAESIDNKVCYS